jgi:serralysin
MKKFFLLIAVTFLLFDTLFAQNICVDAMVTMAVPEGQSGVYFENSKWLNGTTIRVKFLGGESIVKSRIQDAVRTWEQYGNIKFQFVTSGDSDIRIAFNRQKGAYSLLGTQALSASQSVETMNFGWFNSTTSADEIRRTTLHEFGHALGLLHEHQSPLSPIKWNYPVAYAFYMQMLGWTKQGVDNNIFIRYSVAQTNKTFDPNSIMIYPIPGNLTLDGYSVSLNWDLSANDKKLIAELYPFPPTSTPTTAVTTTSGKSVKFSEVNIQHNIMRGGDKGMIITSKFSAYNMAGEGIKLISKFYTNNSSLLTSRYPAFQGPYSELSVWENLTVQLNTEHGERNFFVPYKAINVEYGLHNLKVGLEVVDKNNRPLANSGNYLFTYQNGPSCDEQINIIVGPGSDKLTIEPQLTLNYAKGIPSKFSIYLTYKDGTPVLANSNSGFKAPDGRLVVSTDISACCDQTFFNDGSIKGKYSLELPYSEFPYRKGITSYNMYVQIEDASGEKYYLCNSYNFPFTVTM